MNEDKRIEELQKEIEELKRDCWIGAQAGRETWFEVKTLYSLIRKLQALVEDWSFKRLLFSSLYVCAEDAKLDDTEVDNILHALQDQFKFRCHEWDEYVAFQRATAKLG